MEAEDILNLAMPIKIGLLYILLKCAQSLYNKHKFVSSTFKLIEG